MTERTTLHGGEDRDADPAAGDRSRSRSAIPGTGPDLLNIMQDIEQQFDRLRTVRDEQVNSLRDLSERTTRLEALEEQLKHDQLALESERKTWQQTRGREEQQVAEGRKCLEADRAAHQRLQEDDKAAVARDRQTLEEERQRHQRDLKIRREQLDESRRDLESRENAAEEAIDRLQSTRADLEAERIRLSAEAERQLQERAALRQQLESVAVENQRRRRWNASQKETLKRLRRNRRRARQRTRGLEAAARRYRKDIRGYDVRHQEHHQQLDQARNQLQEFMNRLKDQADLVERGNAALALVDDLRRQIAILQDQAAPPSAPDVDSAESSSEATTESDPRRRQLADIARHLHTRRARLRRIRSRLRRSPGVGQPTPGTTEVQHRLRQSELIEQRQRELDEVRRILTSSEKKMIKRWAAPRALLLTSWCLVMAGVLAGGSWFIADHLHPVVRKASVVLTPRVMAAQSFDEDDAAAWQAMHREQLVSDSFLRDVVRRSATLRLEPWTNFETVSNLVQNDLMIDDQIPSKLTLALASPHPVRAAAFLDILATNMAVAAQRSLNARPGGFVSEVLDQRRDDGVLRHAHIGDQSVHDDRPMAAGVIFGGAVLLTIMVMGLIYGRLLRAKRIFEETHPDDGGLRGIMERPI